LNWFKIYHDGYADGVWAVDTLIQNKGKVSLSIPSCIPAGQYLLRVEIIGKYNCLYVLTLHLILVLQPCMQPRVTLVLNSMYVGVMISEVMLTNTPDGVRSASNYRRWKHISCYCQLPGCIPWQAEKLLGNGGQQALTGSFIRI